MQDITVTTIQYDIAWEDIKTNLNQIENLLNSIRETDLIILPEMFTTGFTMNTSLNSETMNGETIQWMIKQSKKVKANILGSIIIKENGEIFNRLIIASPDGSINHYDKRHLFRMANEDSYYSQGTKKIELNIKGWSICPLICYDLRFPVWSRNINQEIDLYIYIANWPNIRSNAWNTLLKARAIENASYVIGVNRVGKDKNNIFYSGDSSVIDFKGDTLASHPLKKESILTTTLSKEAIINFREKFPVNLDADNFELTE